MMINPSKDGKFYEDIIEDNMLQKCNQRFKEFIFGPKIDFYQLGFQLILGFKCIYFRRLHLLHMICKKVFTFRLSL